jgi:hypothetical protein
MRAHLSENDNLLKGMTDASFKLGGGLTSFALLARVGVSTLSKYASPNEENADNFIPIDIAVAVDKRAESPVIVGEMARQLGYTLTPIAGTIGRRRIDHEFATDMMAESTEAWRVIVDALRDGKIDGLERKQILKEMYEAKRLIEQGIAGMEAGDAA